MGEMIEYPSNGTTGQGYLATPSKPMQGGLTPPLIVFQEWWGLNDHIKAVADRFAEKGFLVLAPDIYRGTVTKEPDEAAKTMMALDMARVAKDMSGAVSELQKRSGREKVGVTGFCMGGGLALVLACQRPDAIKACVPFYGVIPWPEAQPDYSKMAAAVQGHYAEKDGSASPEQAQALQTMLKGLGREVEFYIYQGADHAFFNDTRPEVYDSHHADHAFFRAYSFLRQQLRG